jgi:histidine triad (HIT) family protein
MSGNANLLPDCPFCRIVSGRLRAHEIWRDDTIVAFLDIEPIRPGHVQIAPISHVESFDALPPDAASAILHLGQRVARVQKGLYGVDRVAFLFSGGDVAHAHAHVLPMVEKTDITSRRYIAERVLTWQALPRPDDAVLADAAAALRGALRD